jgi:hypothetical protein
MSKDFDMNTSRGHSRTRENLHVSTIPSLNV